MRHHLTAILGALALLLPAAGASAATPSPAPAAPTANVQAAVETAVAGGRNSAPTVVAPQAPAATPVPLSPLPVVVSPAPPTPTIEVQMAVETAVAASRSPGPSGAAATLTPTEAASPAPSPGTVSGTSAVSVPSVVAQWTRIALDKVRTPSATATPAPTSAGSAASAPAGTVQGTVSLDAPASTVDSQPQPNPILLLTFPGGSRLAQPTDVGGRFTFDNLPPGQYRLALAVSSGFLADPADGVDVTVGPTSGGSVSFAIRVDPNGPSTQPAATPTDGAQAWSPIDPYDPDHLATLLQSSQQSSCGIPWQVLAAIARVESDFGRNMATSSAGAVGYGQFLPSTWAATVGGGDPYDYHAVLPAMATYLCRSGAAGDLGAAVYAYNHADWYVNLVLALAAEYDAVTPGQPSNVIIDTPLQLAQRVHEPYMRYAPNRDARRQGGIGSPSASAFMLNVPFPTPGGAPLLGGSSFRTTGDRALSMLRIGAQVRAPSPPDGQTAASVTQADGLDGLAAAATGVGLTSADLHLRNGSYRTWNTADLIWHLQHGHPVVVPVATSLLPGRSTGSRAADQVVVLTGIAGNDFVYNDPGFVSTLGYGLLISPDALNLAWLAASPDLEAMAIFAPPSDGVAQTLLGSGDAEGNSSTPTAQAISPTAVVAPPTALPAEDSDTSGESTPASAAIADGTAAPEASAPISAVPDLTLTSASTPARETLPVEACLWLGGLGWLALRRAMRPGPTPAAASAAEPSASAPRPTPTFRAVAVRREDGPRGDRLGRGLRRSLKGAVRGSARLARGARRRKAG